MSFNASVSDGQVLKNKWATYIRRLRRYPGQGQTNQDKWPGLVQLRLDTRPGYAIDAYAAEDTFHVAVGFWNGEVRVTEMTSDVGAGPDAPREEVASWPLLYSHSMPDQGVRGEPRVTCLAFSPDRNWLASSSWDGTCIAHNLRTSETLRTSMLEGPLSHPMAEFAPLPHGSVTNMVCWDARSEFIAVAVSRVRKFQGQHHPERIPGTVCIVRVPRDPDSDAPPAAEASASNARNSTASSFFTSHRVSLSVWRDSGYMGGDFESPAAALQHLARVAHLKLNWLPSINSGDRRTASRDAASALPAIWCISVCQVPPSSSLLDRIERVDGRSRTEAEHKVMAANTLLVAAGCGDSKVRGFAYNILDGSGYVFCELQGHHVVSRNGGIWDIAFLPEAGGDNSECRVASAGEDHAVIIWDLTAQSIINILRQPSQGFGVTRLRAYVDLKPPVTRDDTEPLSHLKRGDLGSRTFRAGSQSILPQLPQYAGTPSLPYGTASSGRGSIQDHMEEKFHGRLVLVSASWDGSLRSWDVDSASPLAVYNVVHKDAIFDCSLIVHKLMHPGSTEPQTLLQCVTISRDRSLVLWNFETGSMERSYHIHKSMVTGLQVLNEADKGSSPLLVTASTDGTLCGFDLGTMQVSEGRITSPGGQVRSLSLAPLTNDLAYGDSSGNVHIHRRSRREQETSFFGYGPEDLCLHHREPKGSGMHEINGLCWLPDSLMVMAGCSCGHISIWDTDNPLAPAVTVLDPTSIGAGRLMSPMQQRGALRWEHMASASQRTICIQAPKNVSEVSYLNRPTHVDGAGLSSAGALATGALSGLRKTSRLMMLTGGEDGVVLMFNYNAEVGTVSKLGELCGHSAAVTSVAVSSDGMCCVTGGWDRMVVVWHLTSRLMLRRLKGHVQSVTGVTFVPDSSDVMSISYDQKVIYWDVGACHARHVSMGHEHPITALHVDGEGNVITGDTGGFIVLRPPNVQPSLAPNWKSIIQLHEDMQRDEVEKGMIVELFRTFLQPPAMLVHSTLYPFGTTLLHYFAMIGDVEAVRECFLSTDMPVGLKRDCFGKTALEWAVRMEHGNVVNEILSQVSEYPAQMAEILASALPELITFARKCPLSALAGFLDSRFFPVGGDQGKEPPMPSQVPYVIHGSDTPWMTDADYLRYFGSSTDGGEAGGSGRIRIYALRLPNFARHMNDMNVNGCKLSSLDWSVVQSTAMQVLGSFLWTRYYRSLFIFQFVLYFGFTLFYVAYVVAFRTLGNQRPPALLIVGGVVIALYEISYLAAKVSQIREQGIVSNLHDFWTWIQLETYLTVAAFVIVDFVDYRLDADLKDVLAVLGAFSSWGVIIGVLFYGRGISGLGVFLRMVLQVAFSIGFFILILVVLLLAFLLAFWMLSTTSAGDLLPDGTVGREGDPWPVIWNILKMLVRFGMLGDFMQVNTLPMFSNNVQWLTWIFAIGFLFLLTIVMLNLLIAIMDTYYQSIEERAEVEEKRERFNMMEELYHSLQAKILRRLQGAPWRFPRYLLVTLPEGVVANAESSIETHSRAGRSGAGGQGLDAPSPLDTRVAYLLVPHFCEIEQRINQLCSQLLTHTTTAL